MENQEVEEIKHISVGDWLLTILITIIPFVNIIMLFVWAFSKCTNKSKANWAKASLLWIVISVILATLIIVFFGAVMLGFLESGPDFIDTPSY